MALKVPELILSNTKKLIVKLKNNKRKIITIESCTGGLLSAIITSVSGSSKVFELGFVTYSNNSKVKILKIRDKTISSFGAVSKETAILMSKNAIKYSNCKNPLSLSCTGIAGPNGGTKNKPVGTVFISFSQRNKTEVFHKKFYGLDRNTIRLKTVSFMIDMSLKIIDKN